MQTQTQPKPPKPETTRAWLVSEGTQTPTYTVHHWCKTRLVNMPATKDELGNLEPAHQAWEHMFRCFRTGVERRWGLVLGPAHRQVQEEEDSEETAPRVVYDAFSKNAAVAAVN